MQRIIIVYNPRSSRFSDVKKEVLDPAKNLKGYMVGKYEVEKTNLDANIAKLSKLIKDKDIIVSAGGDATGIIASNGILKSGKDATLAVLPYGNFNDLSRTLGTKKFEDIFNTTNKLYPLEIIVDGKLFRYATCYVTIGMTAEAVKLYDTPTMRRKLKTDFGRKISSYTELAGWYFRHRHKKQFIPEFKLNGVLQHKDTSDYAALNGRSMARVMKGGEDYKDPKIFRSETDRLTNFWRLIRLMFKSVFVRTPGSETTGDTIEFLAPATVEIQTEGEWKKFENIKKIEIRKGKKCLKVIES
ncbi:hypothetical protein IKF43_02045 [Candidatus Saccharibacteria bacterium]|nr:hypothetical protein [Candidatus Saccharibacteria bacterium]